jgi:hypothetical protein
MTQRRLVHDPFDVGRLGLGDLISLENRHVHELKEALGLWEGKRDGNVIFLGEESLLKRLTNIGQVISGRNGGGQHSPPAIRLLRRFDPKVYFLHRKGNVSSASALLRYNHSGGAVDRKKNLAPSGASSSHARPLGRAGLSIGRGGDGTLVEINKLRRR